MWGTEYVAAPPQQHQGNVSICNSYRVMGPLMLQIEIFRQPPTFRLNL